MEFVNKYGLIILLVICSLAFVNGCGNNVKVSKLEKKVDSLSTLVVTQEEMINLLKTTPALETLRLQDLSNKKITPTINIYSDKDKKK